MGWDMPWYSVEDVADALLVGRQIDLMYLVCCLRDGDRVFETYWTCCRGVEAMDNSYALMDLTVFGRQERGRTRPPAGPSDGRWTARLRTDGRPPPSGPGSTPAALTTFARDT